MAKALEARVAALEKQSQEGACGWCQLLAQIHDRLPPASCSCPPVTFEDVVLALGEEQAQRPGAEK